LTIVMLVQCPGGRHLATTVTAPGDEPKRFDLKSASPEVQATTWLGFVSIGSPGAVFHLDNIRLSNSAE